MDYDYLFNKALPISFIILGVVALSYAVFNDDIQNVINEQVNIKCDYDIEAMSQIVNGQYETIATPNHKRPCSQPVLFGGEQ